MFTQLCFRNYFFLNLFLKKKNLKQIETSPQMKPKCRTKKSILQTINVKN